MIHDAFSAGVEPGGLYSGDEIKVLICYLLMHVSERLHAISYPMWWWAAAWRTILKPAPVWKN